MISSGHENTTRNYYGERTTYKYPTTCEGTLTHTSQEDAFTERCDALLRSLQSFWPSQLASHRHLLALDQALSAALPLDSDPRLSVTGFEYNVKLSKLPEGVRGAVRRFMDGVARIEFEGVRGGTERLTPWQRYRLWKASCGSEEGRGRVEVRHSDCVRGWRYDHSQACALLHDIKVCHFLFVSRAPNHVANELNLRRVLRGRTKTPRSPHTPLITSRTRSSAKSVSRRGGTSCACSKPRS